MTTSQQTDNQIQGLSTAEMREALAEGQDIPTDVLLATIAKRDAWMSGQTDRNIQQYKLLMDAYDQVNDDDLGGRIAAFLELPWPRLKPGEKAPRKRKQ